MEKTNLNAADLMDQASDDIRQAEFHLQDNVLVTAKNGPLSWEKDERGKHRIMFSGKPFIEAKVADRIENHKYLRPLFEDVVSRNLKLVASVNPLNDLFDSMFNR